MEIYCLSEMEARGPKSSIGWAMFPLKLEAEDCPLLLPSSWWLSGSPWGVFGSQLQVHLFLPLFSGSSAYKGTSHTD